MKKNGEKVVAQNKMAYHNYLIEETIECGIVLTGTEIKSLRMGKASINDCYCDVKNGEMFIVNMHISPYDKGNIFNHQPNRLRKLLLHKKEIVTLNYKTTKSGYTLVPLKVALRDGRAKVDIGLAKGKKLYDKRESEKTKTIERELKEKY